MRSSTRRPRRCSSTIRRSPTCTRSTATGRSRALLRQVRAEARLLPRRCAQRRYDLLVHLTEHPRGLTLAHAAAARVRRHARARGARVSAGCGSARSRISIRCRKARPRHTVETNLDALRRIGIHPAPDDKQLVMVPGRAGAGARRRDARASADSRARRVRAGASGIALAVQELAARAAWLRSSRSSCATASAIVVTGAPDERERAIVDGMLAALPRSTAGAACTTSPGKLSLLELGALTTRARAVRRRRFGADAHRRRGGHAGRRAVRPVRRARMGTVAASRTASSLRPTSLPSLPQRRLRRRQDLRVPDDAAGRPRARRGRRAARPDRRAATADAARDHPAALHAVRRRRALRRDARSRRCSSATSRSRCTRANGRRRDLQLIEPRIVDPFYVGSLWRDYGFARAVCRASRRARTLDLVQSHERLLALRRLSRRRRRARRLARRAHEARAGALERLSVRASTLAPLRARDRAQAVREPVAAGGDLQLGDGARRDQRSASACRDEKLHVDLQRRRLAGVPPGAARASRAPRATKLGIADDAIVSCSSAPASSARASRPRSRRSPSMPAGAPRRSSAATSIWRAIARSRDRLGVGDARDV